MFLWRNKKKYQYILVEKGDLSGAMPRSDSPTVSRFTQGKQWTPRLHYMSVQADLHSHCLHFICATVYFYVTQLISALAGTAKWLIV